MRTDRERDKQTATDRFRKADEHATRDKDRWIGITDRENG